MGMYICICKGVTDRQIREAVFNRGINRMSHLCKELGACSQCGRCGQDAKYILKQCMEEKISLNQDTIGLLETVPAA